MIDADHAGRALLAIFFLYITVCCVVGLWTDAKRLPLRWKVVWGCTFSAIWLVSVFFFMTDDGGVWFPEN